jgi:hypothetical protein
VTPSLTARRGLGGLVVDRQVRGGLRLDVTGRRHQADDSYDTGTSGRFSSLLADSGGPVAGGSYGALTATTDTASDKAVM